MLLSIVAAAPEGANITDFLDALEQSGFFENTDVEIIIALPHSAAAAPSGVIFDIVERPCSIFELWGAGIRKASAPAIAILDVRCPPGETWLKAIRARLPLSTPALFGPVACGVEHASADIAGYLTEYVQFAPPLDPALKEVPGLNLVLTREIAQDPRVLRGDGFVKTRLLAALEQDHLPAPQPVHDAIVRYRKRYTFSEYCLHRYRHARCYAAQRPMPVFLWSRVLAALATPLLPFVRTWRIFRSIAGKEPYDNAARRYLHHILAAETAWALGELSGYLLGAGRTWRLLR
jgi:hypothetical protein